MLARVAPVRLSASLFSQPVFLLMYLVHLLEEGVTVYDHVRGLRHAATRVHQTLPCPPRLFPAHPAQSLPTRPGPSPRGQAWACGRRTRGPLTASDLRAVGAVLLWPRLSPTLVEEKRVHLPFCQARDILHSLLLGGFKMSPIRVPTVAAPQLSSGFN